MNKLLSIGLVLLTFFIISFVTNLLGPLFPELITSYQIGLTLAGFFPFAFFAAYGLMSIPAGLIAQVKGEKFLILLAFALAGSGATLFVLQPSFGFAMVALFTIGSAMALLQVAINPLLRRVGGEAHFAVYSVIAQLLFGLAGAMAPLLYQFFTGEIEQQTAFGQTLALVTSPGKDWLIMYALFALIAVVMFVLTLATPIHTPNNVQANFSLTQVTRLFRDKTVFKFFMAIVAYVALEQGVANSISIFLQQYHNIDAKTLGADSVASFWLMLTFGCLLGVVLLKLFDAKHVLMVFTLGATLSLLCALYGNARIALFCFPLIGFFLSIMWSVIFSLALNSVANNHSAIAGILCTGIVGGAIASPIIGLIEQLTGNLQFSLLILLLPLGYIASVAIWAKPLVKNHTLFSANKLVRD